MDRPLTVRFSPAEFAEIGELAAAAGCSRAEIVRRQWRHRRSVSIDEIADAVAGIAAMVVQIDERLDALTNPGPSTEKKAVDDWDL